MSTDSDLSVRVAALERQNRRLRRLIPLAAFGAAAVPVLAAFATFQDPDPTTDEVRARRIVVVDERGAERFVLGVTEGNESRFVIRDDAGADRVQLGVDARAGYVLLRDDSGRKRIGMACDAFPHLMLHDHFEKPRIHASVGITTAPSLLFIDREGNFALGMGLDAEGKVWRRPSEDGVPSPADTAEPGAAAGEAQAGEVLPPGGRKRKDR